MKRAALCVALAAVAVSSAESATIYRWEDDKGVVNFTEDYGKIPEKYQKRVRIFGEVQEGGPVTIKEVPTEKPGETKAGSQSPAEQAKKKTYGGRDEQAWRLEFERQKVDIRSLEDQLAAIDARLQKSSDQMSRSEYRTLEYSRDLINQQLEGARKRFDALSSEARRAGVPADLR